TMRGVSAAGSLPHGPVGAVGRVGATPSVVSEDGALPVQLLQRDREQAASLLQSTMWGIGGEERHRDALAPMDTVLPRIDPTASNPRVQANATAGFQTGVVRITADEYEAVFVV